MYCILNMRHIQNIIFDDLRALLACQSQRTVCILARYLPFAPQSIRFLAEPCAAATGFMATRAYVVTWLQNPNIRGVNMTITTISSREFNQGASEAKRAANNGPVFITDRGRPAHVLMRFEDYQQLTRQRRNIADALAMPGIADIEFEPPRVVIETRPADFS